MPSAANALMWLGQIWRSHRYGKILKNARTNPIGYSTETHHRLAHIAAKWMAVPTFYRQMFHAEHPNHADFEPHTLLGRLYYEGRHCTAEPPALTCAIACALARARSVYMAQRDNGIIACARPARRQFVVKKPVNFRGYITCAALGARTQTFSGPSRTSQG